MTITTLELPGPPQGGHFEGHGGGGFFDALFGLGGFLLIVAILIAGFLILQRYGFLPNRQLFARRTAPEDSARQILAERFANGDLSTEEFMERASVLNWTPGVEPKSPRKRRSLG